MMLGTAAGSGSFVLTLQEEAEILEAAPGREGRRAAGSATSQRLRDSARGGRPASPVSWPALPRSPHRAYPLEAAGSLFPAGPGIGTRALRAGGLGAQRTCLSMGQILVKSASGWSWASHAL